MQENTITVLETNTSDLNVVSFCNETENIQYFVGWIRVDTLDRNHNPRWHSRAILQLNDSFMGSPTSNRRNCTPQDPCHILNCPFSQYGSGLDVTCLTMQNMTTDATFYDADLVSDTTHVTIKRSLSLTAVEPTDEEAGYESINYISILYPRLDEPILYVPKMAREKLPCSSISDTTSSVKGQRCYHNIIAEYGDIIEFLIANYDSDQHPMHLHGSFFHVIEQGLSVLNQTTGLFMTNNPNVACDNEQINCACVNCTSNARLVKDTILVPSGG